MKTFQSLGSTVGAVRTRHCAGKVSDRIGQYRSIAKGPGVRSLLCSVLAQVFFVPVVSHHQLPSSCISGNTRIASIDIPLNSIGSVNDRVQDIHFVHRDWRNLFHSMIIMEQSGAMAQWSFLLSTMAAANG